MPNSGGVYVGYHSEPKMKLKTETTLNIGTASLNRKTTISARASSEAMAIRKKMFLIMISFSRLDMFLNPNTAESFAHFDDAQ